MLSGKKIVVVLPAYNASQTLADTYHDIPFNIVDEVVLVDDCSNDSTVKVARELGIEHIVVHQQNRGYGGNQKSCYEKAIALGADIIIMLHPDYQYEPKLIPSMANLIAHEIFPVVLGSRILGNGALKGGMPLYKYLANRFLTLFQNLLNAAKLSEYHTGYRAFSTEVIQSLKLDRNSDDFVFDNQMLSQIIMKDIKVGEVTCPTKYFHEASSINFRRSVKYGLGVLSVSLQHWLHKKGIIKNKRY